AADERRRRRGVRRGRARDHRPAHARWTGHAGTLFDRSLGLAVSLMRFFSHRRREAEWMDEPGVDPAELAKSLRFIRGVNAALLYTRSTLRHLQRFSRTWKPGEQIRIIDLATGSADVPLAVVRWADRRGFDLRVVGVGPHEPT